MSDPHHRHAEPLPVEAATAGNLSEIEKIGKRLEHWIDHNNDHAAGYRQWAERIQSMGYAEAAERLRKAADLTDATSREFADAAAIIRHQAPKR